MEEINSWEILDNRESLDFRRVVHIRCKNCGFETELIVDNLDDLKDIKCDCNGGKARDRHSEYLNSNMGLDLKLSNTYKKLEKDNLLSDDFDMYFKFKKYCLDNGYKPWYAISRKDKNKKYSLDNILITCGDSGKKEGISFSSVREASNSLCLLENKTNNVVNSINSLVDTLEKFSDVYFVDIDIIEDMKRLGLELFKLSRELKEDIDSIDIKFKNK